MMSVFHPFCAALSDALHVRRGDNSILLTFCSLSLKEHRRIRFAYSIVQWILFKWH